MARQGNILREGVMAGLLGAGGVALWFFAVDLLAGRPLYTPALLGSALLSVLGHGIHQGMLFNAAAYTVLHVLAFVGVGFVASELLDVSRRIPQVAAGLALFFAVFELGFYFFAMAVSGPEILGALGSDASALFTSVDAMRSVHRDLAVLCRNEMPKAELEKAMGALWRE